MVKDLIARLRIYSHIQSIVFIRDKLLQAYIIMIMLLIYVTNYYNGIFSQNNRSYACNCKTRLLEVGLKC